jgi:hypothetical protein
MIMAKTDKETPPRLTGAEKMRLNKIMKENPVYFDKVIRDIYGPPPRTKKPSTPELRDKKGRVTRALLSKGGSVRKAKK